MMKERLKEISQKAREQILGAASIQDAEALRVEYLGKKGKLTDMLKSMKDLAPEERKAFGQLANETKTQIESLISDKMAELKALAREMQLKSQTIDVSKKITKLTCSEPFDLDVSAETDLIIESAVSDVMGRHDIYRGSVNLHISHQCLPLISHQRKAHHCLTNSGRPDQGDNEEILGFSPSLRQSHMAMRTAWQSSHHSLSVSIEKLVVSIDVDLCFDQIVFPGTLVFHWHIFNSRLTVKFNIFN